MDMRRIVLAATLTGAAGCFAQVAAPDEPAATPYRPTVSTPATLSAPGWLELEFGLTHAHADAAAHRDNTPYTLKLAFTPDWGIRIAGDGWVRQTDESGQRASGFGDSGLVLKRRFAVDDAQAFGLEVGGTWPSGAASIRRRKADYSLNAIYSVDHGPYHVDLNLSPTRVGDVDSGQGRMQWLWAASLSKTLSDSWGVEGEMSGTWESGVQGTTQFLAAATYSVSKSLVLDAGAAHSVRSGAHGWSAFVGLTVVTVRLF
jgi:hypothetical protein